jgi:hypothetical protein
LALFFWHLFGDQALATPDRGNFSGRGIGLYCDAILSEVLRHHLTWLDLADGFRVVSCIASASVGFGFPTKA